MFRNKKPASIAKTNASQSKQWDHRVLHIFGVKWQTNYSRTKLPNEQCPNKQTKKINSACEKCLNNYRKINWRENALWIKMKFVQNGVRCKIYGRTFLRTQTRTQKKTKYNNFIGASGKSAFRRGNYIVRAFFTSKMVYVKTDLAGGEVITPENGCRAMIKAELIQKQSCLPHLTYYWNTLTRLCNRLWCDVDGFSAHPPFFYFHREFKLKIFHFLHLFRFICHQFQCINWIINYPRARATSTTCIVHAIDFAAHPWFLCLSSMHCAPNRKERQPEK